MIDPQLKDKVVLITGANHGIGAETARRLADQGAKVFITYYHLPRKYTDEELAEAEQAGIGGDVLYRARQHESAAEVVNRIQAKGGAATALQADLSDANSIPQLFDACEKTFGAVDILINNHTHCELETFDPALVTDENGGVSLTNADSIDKHFVINARAVALLMREYVERYLARSATQGRIVNISTDAAHAHTANISYAASKHAIESYSRSAAVELGKYGITVNIVSPGPIQTGYITPESEKWLADNTPLLRIGEPDDVADVIIFMVSAQARWLTGQLIYVGGGWRMGQ